MYMRPSKATLTLHGVASTRLCLHDIYNMKDDATWHGDQNRRPHGRSGVYTALRPTATPNRRRRVYAV